MAPKDAGSYERANFELLDDPEAFVREIAARVLAEQQATATTADEWLTVARAAEVAGVSEWTIREAVRRGELEASRPRPRCVRIRRAELRRWVEKDRAAKPKT